MNKNYKTFVKYIATCGIVVFAAITLIFRLNKGGYNIETFAGDIGYATTVTCLLAAAFNLWIWRWPWIGRLLHTPNLRGIWEGKGKSSHDNNEYAFKLKISQTFLETHVHGYFEKSQSDSFSSVFVHNDTIDRTMFIYSYQNDPKLEYRNKAERGEEGGLNIHYGTTKLDIDFEDLKHLSGSYWNDRECVGSINLTKAVKQ